jgi:hypothetical protein
MLSTFVGVVVIVGVALGVVVGVVLWRKAGGTTINVFWL